MNYLFQLFHQGTFRLFPGQQTLSSPVSPLNNSQVQQGTPAKPPEPLPGRDLMYALIREHLVMQIQTGDQLDTKASGVLVWATTLVGFAFLAQHHPAGNCSSLLPLWLHQWPLAVRLALPYIPFLFSYVLAVVFTVLAFRIHTYWMVPDPVTALKRMHEPEQALKESLSQAIAHYAKKNEATIKLKAKRVQWAVSVLLSEVAFLVLLLVYQTIC